MKKGKHDKLLTTALKRFQRAVEAEHDQRVQMLDDLKFEDGAQWSAADKALRKGRPLITINKTAGHTRKIKNDLRQNRQTIKVRPNDSGADLKVAGLLNGIIRSIENMSDAEAAYDMGVENAVDGGLGVWRIVTKYADDATFDQDILIERVVNQFSVYRDPDAVKPDLSDIKWAFVVEELTTDDYAEKYPDEPASGLPEGIGETGADWRSETKIRVAEYFYKVPETRQLFLLADGRTISLEKFETAEVATPDGQLIKAVVDQSTENAEPLRYTDTRVVPYDCVYWCKISGTGLLEAPQKWPGKYIPIVFCPGEEKWIEGKVSYRSVVRNAKDPARLYNWARSNEIETLALTPKQPVVTTPNAIKGFEHMWDTANSVPRAYLLVNDGFENAWKRSSPSIGDPGHNQAAMMADADLKACTGQYDAALGNKSQETSGRAIIARQRQSDISAFAYTDNQTRAIKYTGRILVDLIPKIYNTQRVIRLLNEDGKEGWAQINVVDPVTGRIVANDLSVGRYDVTMDAGPGYSTRRLEAADGMIQLASMAPDYAPLLIPRIAKNLDWPEAQEIADEIQAMNQPPEPPPPDPEVGLDLEGKALDNEKKKRDLSQMDDEMQAKIMQIAQIAVAEALASM
jgi:hypothetical protein